MPPRQYVVIGDQHYFLDSTEGVQEAHKAMIAKRQHSAQIMASAEGPWMTGQKLLVDLPPEPEPVSESSVENDAVEQPITAEGEPAPSSPEPASEPAPEPVPESVPESPEQSSEPMPASAEAEQKTA
jgi:hypothetical protein